MSINWQTQYPTISTIIRRYAAGICKDRGWCVDDVISGTVERIWRQSRQNPYDSSRGSLGHYVILHAKAWISDQLTRSRERHSHVSTFDADDGEPTWDIADPAVQPDDMGCTDEQIADLHDLLLDARLTLAERRQTMPHLRDSQGRYIARAVSADISYRALLTWLTADRDVDATCRITGLCESDLLTYLAWVVATLENHADQPYRRTWAAIRQSVRRRLQWARQATDENAHSAIVDAS